MSRVCMRCGTLEQGTDFVVTGVIVLCRRCFGTGLAAPCGDFHHTFHGALCMACGYIISHRPVLEPPPPPKPPVYIDYC